MSKKSKKIKISAIDEDVLTVLWCGREMYGLEILDEVNNGRPVILSYGSLYPALYRLENRDLVTAKWGEECQEAGGARRKYYKITGLGSITLQEVREYRNQLYLKSLQGQMY